MLQVPHQETALIRFTQELIEQCMQSSRSRAAQCRLINAIVETGRTDGAKSKLNMLYNHIDRLTGFLYSPTDLRFTIDFENDYPEQIYERAAVVARGLTRDWERNDTDTKFGTGVFESLKYGSCFLKQWTEMEDEDEVSYNKRIVAQWNFGAYTEDENDLSKQEVLCERMYLTMPEVWQRIHKLPGAPDLFKKIKAHARQGESDWDSTSYFHQVLSTTQINASGAVNPKPPAGGLVDLANNQNYSMLSPNIAVDRVLMHELWVKGPRDYITIQMVDPEIIITPFRKDKVVMKMQNLLVPGDMQTRRHPYTLIQPNETEGYLFGRSEIADLIEPQMLLSTNTDDAARLLGVQIDKILGLLGVDGLTDELFDKMHGSGWAAVPPGASIQDLTPKFPPELLPMLKFYIEQINTLGGFTDLLQGRGESGVRAGIHANTLMKTGSPRLRDRSLLVERQCAKAADLTLTLKTAKDGGRYWTKAETLQDITDSTFLLTDLPDDRRVGVDSHSSSPIFADDHQQLTAFGLKAGFIDGEEAIDDLPYPNRERKKQRLRIRRKQQAEQIKQLQQQDPEAYAKLLSKGGGKR
jgi:hypothetical protein